MPDAHSNLQKIQSLAQFFVIFYKKACLPPLKAIKAYLSYDGVTPLLQSLKALKDYLSPVRITTPLTIFKSP